MRKVDPARNKWLVVTPFKHDYKIGWIPAHISPGRHEFAIVPARYKHNRSRPLSGGREWLDYLLHAATAMRRSWNEPTAGFITSFPQLAACLGLLKRLTGSRAPILAWCFNMGKTYSGIKGRLARFGLRSVDLFVVHSTAEIEIYARWLDIPSSRFRFVPLSIADQVIPDVDCEDVVASLGTANRDYATLMAALKKTRKPARIVAGSAAVAGLEVLDTVSVESGLSLEQCHALSRSARVNVIPLRDVDNASGQVTLLETMAMKRPVIATRCAGTVDYISDGENGLLVPPGDVEALAAAIERIWNDPDLGNRLGSAGADMVRARSSFPAVAKDMDRMLVELTGAVR